MKKSSEDKDENILFQNEICTIRYDNEYKIRIEDVSTDYANKIADINSIMMDLNNMPVSKQVRRQYWNEMKNIYLMALNNQEKSAKEYAQKLKKIMERNLELKRAIEYTVPATIIFLVTILLSYVMFIRDSKDIYYVFIFSSLGGILSLLYQQKKLEIDYKVYLSIIIIESIKRVIMTLCLGSIGYIAIKSKVIFANFDMESNRYLLFLFITICGYSTSFIPNILDKIVTNNKEKE